MNNLVSNLSTIVNNQYQKPMLKSNNQPQSQTPQFSGIKSYLKNKIVPRHFDPFNERVTEYDFSADRYKVENHFSHLDFDYDQDVKLSLRKHLDTLSHNELVKIAVRFPLIADAVVPELNPESEQAEWLKTLSNTEDLKDLIVNVQHQALREFTSYMLTAEQGIVPPVGNALLDFNRDIEVQHDLTKFADDEIKHSIMFKHYLERSLKTTPLESPDSTWLMKTLSVMGTKQGLWSKAIDKIAPIEQFGPSMLFMPLIFEAMAFNFFIFFADQVNEPLFQKMMRDITIKDEAAHQKMFTKIYNGMFNNKRKDLSEFKSEKQQQKKIKLENQRNDMSFNTYGVKNYLKEYTSFKSPMMKMCIAFGADATEFFEGIAKQLSDTMAGIDYEVTPEEILSKVDMEKMEQLDKLMDIDAYLPQESTSASLALPEVKSMSDTDVSALKSALKEKGFKASKNATYNTFALNNLSILDQGLQAKGLIKISELITSAVLNKNEDQSVNLVKYNSEASLKSDLNKVTDFFKAHGNVETSDKGVLSMALSVSEQLKLNVIQTSPTELVFALNLSN